MIDFGTRQRCENCKYGHCEYNYKVKPLKSYCTKLKVEIKGKEFERLSNCMYFERKEK